LKIYLLVLELEDKKQKLFYHFLGLISWVWLSMQCSKSLLLS